MDAPIALTQRTYDRFGRAADFLEQHMRGNVAASRPGGRSGSVPYLKVIAGTVTADGHPAYVQVSDDNGATWSDYDSNYVRLKSPAGATLTAGQSYRAVAVGVNSSGEVCYDTLAEPAGVSLSYTGQYLESGHVFSAFGTWEEVADWEGVSGILFPSVGIWQVNVNLDAGALAFSPTNTAQIRFRVTGISGVSEIIAPDYGLGAANSVEAYTMAGWDSANGSRYDGCTIPIIVDVETANTKALLVESRIDRSDTSYGSATWASVNGTRSWMVGVKIG